MLSALRPSDLPALVVAPKRVAEHVWPVEAKLWRPELSVSLATGTPAKRAKALDSGADLVVISRDNLGDLATSNARGGLTMTAQPWRTIVFDELSSFKNRATRRWRVARLLTCTSNVRNVWGLTGTPAPNGLLDLWPQIALLDGGERLERTITAYRQRYFTPGPQLRTGVVTRWDLRPGADELIHAKLDDICMSMRTLGRLDLPPMVVNPITVTMPPAACKAYRTLKRDLILEITPKDIITALSAGALTSKLSQAAAGFVYDTPGDGLRPKAHQLHTAKLDALREIIEGTGDNVLVFYRFIEERQQLLDALAEYRPRLATEQGAVDAWSRREIRVMLAHPASAGHGLNLQHGGHTAVWTSLPWSLEEWEQSNRRLARQGQTESVVIHVLLAADTIDGAILDRLAGKARVQDALMAHLEAE